MTAKLKGQLPEMLAEHRAIVQALERLVRIAKEDHNPQKVLFAEKQMTDARGGSYLSYCNFNR